MTTNANASTPTPGTGAALGTAASSIASLLSDDFTIGGKQDHGETRDPSNGKDKPPHEHREHEESDEHDDGQQPGDGEHDDEHDDHEGGEHDDEHDESDESDEQDGAEGLTDDTEVTVPAGDGKTEKVTLGELKKGYLRQADYTRKTQALATERQTIQREQAEAREERAKYQQGLEQVSVLIQQMTPQEPTQAQWDALYAQDPQEWQRQRELWRSWKEQQAALANEYAQVQQRQHVDFAKALQAKFAEEAEKLREAIPEWADPKTAKADKDAIKEYALSLGYTPEEIANTVDHRIFVIARKAMLYDKMMTTKKSLKPSAPPQTTKVVRPGTQATKPSNRTAVTEARQRLAKTGNVRDAASLIEKLI